MGLGPTHLRCYTQLRAGVAYAAACQLTFEQGTILPLIYPPIALAAGVIGMLDVSHANAPPPQRP